MSPSSPPRSHAERKPLKPRTACRVGPQEGTSGLKRLEDFRTRERPRLFAGEGLVTLRFLESLKSPLVPCAASPQLLFSSFSSLLLMCSRWVPPQ